MGQRTPTFPFDAEITLESGTVVALHLPGEYTLDWDQDGPAIDVPWRIDFIHRGEMEEDRVNSEIQQMVNEIMKPVVFSDPDVVAHLNSSAEGSSPPEDMSPAPRSPRRCPRPS